MGEECSSLSARTNAFISSRLAQTNQILVSLTVPSRLLRHMLGYDDRDPDQPRVAYAEAMSKEPAIRAPASTIAPHRVIFARTNRFFGRKSNGKYEMDTQELRDAFTASEASPTRLCASSRSGRCRAARRSADLPWRRSDRHRFADPHHDFSRGARPQCHPETCPRPAQAIGSHGSDLDDRRDAAAHQSWRTGRGEVLCGYAPDRPHRYGLDDRPGGRRAKKSEIKPVLPKRFEDGLLDAAISGASWLNHYGIDDPWL